jgi:hypothetical protein
MVGEYQMPELGLSRFRIVPFADHSTLYNHSPFSFLRLFHTATESMVSRLRQVRPPMVQIWEYRKAGSRRQRVKAGIRNPRDVGMASSDGGEAATQTTDGIFRLRLGKAQGSFMHNRPPTITDLARIFNAIVPYVKLRY